MTIAEALRTCTYRLGWSPTKLGAEFGATERQAYRWLDGSAQPSGDRVLEMQRRLPGFHDLLGIENPPRLPAESKVVA